MKIKKAVFPVAGLGTRFLPATKASPKEMMPLVDKPLIQYVVEEAIDAGIEEMIMITGRGKNAIEDHFDISFELEHTLKGKNNNKLLEEVQRISNLVDFWYIRQKEPLGLGHAILRTKDLIGDEPFAVLLGDDIIHSNVPAIKQLIQVYEKYNASVIAVEKVDKKEISSYGVIAPKEIEDRVYQIMDMVEKPPPSEAPSDLAIIGRYILTPQIFEALEKTDADKSGEIQLTNGLRRLLKHQVIYAHQFEGKRYDAGNKLGFLKATVEFALRRPDLGKDFREYLRSLRVDEFMS
ncbi:MAG: UTP--glucose-1-phosphate uridylyltransferase GalU [Nitrospinae bacterium]|nr:UTP--glucose-1-phosphate uridylyltransferase GalU [Nitrospinota bacterium]